MVVDFYLAAPLPVMGAGGFASSPYDEFALFQVPRLWSPYWTGTSWTLFNTKLFLFAVKHITIHAFPIMQKHSWKGATMCRLAAATCSSAAVSPDLSALVGAASLPRTSFPLMGETIIRLGNAIPNQVINDRRIGKG